MQTIMKDIEIKLASKDISPHNEISGTVVVNYPGLYDGVVINTCLLYTSPSPRD